MLNWLKLNICEIEILNEQSYLKLRKTGKTVLNFCGGVLEEGIFRTFEMHYEVS